MYNAVFTAALSFPTIYPAELLEHTNLSHICNRHLCSDCSVQSSGYCWLLFFICFFLYFRCYCDMYAVAVRNNFQSATCRKYVKSAEGNLPDYAPSKEMPRQVKFVYVCLCEPSSPYIVQNSFTKN